MIKRKHEHKKMEKSNKHIQVYTQNLEDTKSTGLYAKAKA